jgi:hypothetical protein
MPKSSKPKTERKRVKVKDLSKGQKKVSGDEMKKVKGGYMKVTMKDVLVSSVTQKP